MTTKRKRSLKMKRKRMTSTRMVMTPTKMLT